MLKGIQFLVENDYSRRTHLKRKILGNRSNHERENGVRDTIINDRVRIGDDFYVWYGALCCRVNVSAESCFTSHGNYLASDGVIRPGPDNFGLSA